MINLKKANKEYLREERFINGFNSDGETITYLLNGKQEISVEYDEEIELKLLDTMGKQMKDSVEQLGSIQYRAYEEQIIAATGLSLSASLLAFGECIAAKAFCFPAAVLPLITWGTEYSNYVKDAKKIDSIDKYALYLENQELLNAYAEKLFREAGEPEGFIPAYVTPNDVDGYSLKELQELIDGIKAENDEVKLTLN